jgi:hypothetical protein
MLATFLQIGRNAAGRRLVVLPLLAAAGALLVYGIASAAWLPCLEEWVPPCGAAGDPNFTACAAISYDCPEPVWTSQGWDRVATRNRYCGVDLGSDEDCQILQYTYVDCYWDRHWKFANCTGTLDCWTLVQTPKSWGDRPGCY